MLVFIGLDVLLVPLLIIAGCATVLLVNIKAILLSLLMIIGLLVIIFGALALLCKLFGVKGIIVWAIAFFVTVVSMLYVASIRKTYYISENTIAKVAQGFSRVDMEIPKDSIVRYDGAAVIQYDDKFYRPFVYKSIDGKTHTVHIPIDSLSFYGYTDFLWNKIPDKFNKYFEKE